MQRFQQTFGRAGTGAALALVAALAIVIVSCSTQPGNVVGPTGVEPPDSLAQGMPGGDTCPAGGTKVNSTGGTFTFASPVTSVCIKAGQTTGLVIEDDQTGGCYTVTGLDTTTVTVIKVGSGPDCQGISHFRVYFGTPEPSPEPSPE